MLKNLSKKYFFLLSGLNHSCYEHIAFIWWTDNETSSFNEMKIPNLDQKSVQLKGLEPDLKYYIQIDLIAPQNIQMYSTTKSFNLTHGPFDTPKGKFLYILKLYIGTFYIKLRNKFPAKIRPLIG